MLPLPSCICTLFLLNIKTASRIQSACSCVVYYHMHIQVAHAPLLQNGLCCQHQPLRDPL